MAQDQPVKAEGVASSIYYVRFKAGSAARVEELETKFFIPASKSLGRDGVKVVNMETGPWHRIYIFPLVGGMASLDWKLSADDIKWRKALDAIPGSPGAKKLLEDWNAAVERSENHLGFLQQ